MEAGGCKFLLVFGYEVTKDTDTKIVELELAAVVWAIRKCRIYLSGLPNFTLMVDNQALVAILDRYTLDPAADRIDEYVDTELAYAVHHITIRNISNICSPEDELDLPSHLTDNLLEYLRA